MELTQPRLENSKLYGAAAYGGAEDNGVLFSLKWK